MLTLDDMRQLRDAYAPYMPVTEAEVLAQIGHPDRETIIDTALAGMQSADRNVRVLMLRVLGGQSGERAMGGILAGLNDPQRRVRQVAIQSCANYLEFPAITDRLKAMVLDETEKRKIRHHAMNALAGGMGGLVAELSETAAEALTSLAQMDQYRFAILFGLLTLDINERVEALLKDFVTNGSKDEAIMATRALCGYRVINIGVFDGHKAIQQQVMQTCDIALGRVWYWIKRDEFDALNAALSTES